MNKKNLLVVSTGAITGFIILSLIVFTRNRQNGVLKIGMLALRLESPIQVPLLLLEKDHNLQSETLQALLSGLKRNIEGKDETNGTDYKCTLSQDFRIIQIESKRTAWKSSWTAEVHVISSDQWYDMEGHVQLLCFYLYGPRKSFLSQVGAGSDAATKISARLEQAISDLVASSEFADRISLLEHLHI